MISIADIHTVSDLHSQNSIHKYPFADAEKSAKNPAHPIGPFIMYKKERASHFSKWHSIAD